MPLLWFPLPPIHPSASASSSSSGQWVLTTLVPLLRFPPPPIYSTLRMTPSPTPFIPVARPLTPSAPPHTPSSVAAVFFPLQQPQIPSVPVTSLPQPPVPTPPSPTPLSPTPPLPAAQAQQQLTRKRGPVVLPYTPTMGPVLRRLLEKRGFKVIFKSGVALRHLLCGKNRDKPPCRRCIYKLHCSCNNVPSNAYVGYTTRRVDQRMNEHRGYARRGENSSGIAQHLNTGCGGSVDFKKPEILATVQCKSKKQADFLLKVREGMEIRCHWTGPGKGFNENHGNLPTSQWDPLFTALRNET